jgi:hypothetical protein
LDLVAEGLLHGTKENVMEMNRGSALQVALAACLSLACAQAALAEEFSLDIGSPVAAGSFRAKTAVFAVRSKGCAEAAKAELSGTAEGLAGGERRTVALLRIVAMPTPGVFTVSQEWGPEGIWVVSLTGRCDAATAGALVPVGPKGFVRESSQFFSRSANKEEIEAALQSHAEKLRQQPPGADR